MVGLFHLHTCGLLSRAALLACPAT